MNVIVHDESLWRQYRSLSEAAHQSELHQSPPIKWRTLYTSVGEFEIRFGKDRTYFRAKVAEGDIVRDDLFIVKGDEVAAQIVDYIAYYSSGDGSTGFTCLPFYKDLIIGKDQK